MKQWEVTQSTDLIITNSALAASVLKHAKQEPVHLLYAMTMLQNEVSPLLKKYGLTLNSVRQAVLKLSITPFVGDRRTIEVFSHDAVAIINDAIRIARTDGHIASPGHLLMALIKSNDKDVMEVFSKLAVHPGALLRDTTEEVRRLHS